MYPFSFFVSPTYPLRGIETTYRDFHDAYRSIGRFVDEVYTRKRIHSALGELAPVEDDAN